jgi:hypothetical protein
MIKLKQITTENAEIILLFEYDQDSQVYSVKLSYNDIRERLKRIKDFLGRSLTVQDVKLVVIKIINEIRANQIPLLERFDFGQFIGVDLET